MVCSRPRIGVCRVPLCAGLPAKGRAAAPLTDRPNPHCQSAPSHSETIHLAPSLVVIARPKHLSFLLVVKPITHSYIYQSITFLTNYYGYPMKREGTVHYFYQSGKLSSVQQGGQISRSIQTPDIPLAQRNTDTLLGTGLLAVENGGSVLRLHALPKTEVHAFTAYGYDLTLPSSSTVLGFNAERLDTGSESYVLGNGYRVFSPILMRFLSPDSLSPFDDGGINGYAYCAGDPINHLDPSGHVQGGKNGSAVPAPQKEVTFAPLPPERRSELDILKQKRAKLTPYEPRLREDQNKVLNYSYHKPGNLKKLDDLLQNARVKNEIAASGHRNSDAAFKQIVDAQQAESAVKHFYNVNPGVQNMYELNNANLKLDLKISSLDRKINSLENKVTFMRNQ